LRLARRMGDITVVKLTSWNCVIIDAYDDEQRLVLHEVYSTGDWYDGDHPIIDSNEERARLHVTRIEGEQYDLNGEVDVRWVQTYDGAGVLTRSQQWRADGSTTVRHLVNGTMMEVGSAPAE
jgi:hypothetical protein